MRNFLRVLFGVGLPLALVTALLCLALAAAAVAAPSYHSNLADDPLVPRLGLADTVPTLTAPVSQPGCTTKLLGTNFSSRSGVQPRLIVLHYTVSKNVAGWSDVDAIRNYFNRSSTQASSHYLIDFEGNCELIVRESNKAWTQGNMNPHSVSIEFIAVGSERVWPEAGLRKGAKVVAAIAKRIGVPIRRGSAPACFVLLSGILDHDALGCGNSHTDVSPYFPWTKFMAYTKEAAAALVAPVVATPWKVRVDPVGDAKRITVWKGIKQPNVVTVRHAPATDGKEWEVVVDPNGPTDAKVVWRGKLYPVVTAGRLS